MTSRWWKRLLIAVFVLALLVIVYDRFGIILWQGMTDLEIEFVITDADSGKPVPKGRIEIQEMEPRNEPFGLIADDAGIARKICPDCRTGGAHSRLRFTDSWVLKMPSFMLHVTAAGYDPSARICLWEPKYREQVRRIGAGQAKLVVPIFLEKKQASLDS